MDFTEVLQIGAIAVGSALLLGGCIYSGLLHVGDRVEHLIRESVALRRQLGELDRQWVDRHDDDRRRAAWARDEERVRTQVESAPLRQSILPPPPRPPRMTRPPEQR